ncbi:unnamed protein product [Urochloa humidicola]
MAVSSRWTRRSAPASDYSKCFFSPPPHQIQTAAAEADAVNADPLQHEPLEEARAGLPRCRPQRGSPVQCIHRRAILIAHPQQIRNRGGSLPRHGCLPRRSWRYLETSHQSHPHLLLHRDFSSATRPVEGPNLLLSNFQLIRYPVVSGFANEQAAYIEKEDSKKLKQK